VTEAAKVDTTRPNAARVYDYLLGGRDNFAADRAMAERMIAVMPTAKIGAQLQREVLARVVRYLVRDEGVTQLLDIGSGLPTAQNVHQIAQRLNPDVRVVYLDNDPVVISHAIALLTDDKRTFAVEGDLRDPEGVLAAACGTLSWNQPVGLVLCGILHQFPDEEKPADLVAALVDGLPSGSCVFVNHLVKADASASLEAAMRKGLSRIQFRTPGQIRDLFGGLELVEPGLVPSPEWRPDGPLADPTRVSLAWAGVARKPLPAAPAGVSCEVGARGHRSAADGALGRAGRMSALLPDQTLIKCCGKAAPCHTRRMHPRRDGPNGCRTRPGPEP
jgi:S-adenosyl methyltransferase